MSGKGLELINLGLSSETASGLSEPDHPFPRPCIHDRIDKILEESKPDWVVACYGMNDGIYYPFSEQRFEAYKEGLSKVVHKINAIGAKTIIMTPPPFDIKSMTNTAALPENAEKYSYMEPYEDYNSVLEKYSEWILKELVEAVDRVVDVRAPLSSYIALQRSLDPGYISGDSIHPNENGHWVMAKTFLKELFNISVERRMEEVLGSETVRTSEWKGYERQGFLFSWQRGHPRQTKVTSAGKQVDLENRIL